MPRAYTYEKAGKYKIKISGNLKSAVFSGNGNNGLAMTLVEVNKLDKNIEELSENAFIECYQLSSVNLSSSNVKVIKENAFQSCTSLKNLTYNTELHTISSSCFSDCQSLAVVAPISYEQDISYDNLYQISKLTNVGDNIFENNTSLRCIVVPENVTLKTVDDKDKTTYSSFLANSTSINHIVFLQMTKDNEEMFIYDILASNMFGMSMNCIFEGKTTDAVYQYIFDASGGSIVKKLVNADESNKTTYMNLSISKLPDKFSDLEPAHTYKYDSQYVEYCLNNNINFMVVYLDSKTSSKTKLFLDIEDVDTILFNQNARTAVAFLLDRHNPTSGDIQYTDINHYRSVILEKISTKQALIHSSTDTKAILDFPEVSFISKGGIKFQKMSLVIDNYNTLQAQLENAAGNIFNE